MNLNVFRTIFSSYYYSIHILPHSGWRFCFDLLFFFSFEANFFFFSFKQNSLMFYFESIMQPKAQMDIFCRCLMLNTGAFFEYLLMNHAKFTAWTACGFSTNWTEFWPQIFHNKSIQSTIFFEIHFLLIENRLKN